MKIVNLVLNNFINDSRVFKTSKTLAILVMPFVSLPCMMQRYQKMKL